MQTSDKFKAGGTSLEVIKNPSKYIENVDDLEDLEDLISSTPAIDGEFRFDILFTAKDNGITYKVFVDTKNYSATSGIFADLTQIKAYMKEIKTFKEFRIIQQERQGINLENMKKAFQTAISKDPKSFYKSNETLFNKIIFNNNKIENVEDFTDFVKSIEFKNSPLSDIIKITK